MERRKTSAACFQQDAQHPRASAVFLTRASNYNLAPRPITPDGDLWARVSHAGSHHICACGTCGNRSKSFAAKKPAKMFSGKGTHHWLFSTSSICNKKAAPWRAAKQSRNAGLNRFEPSVQVSRDLKKELGNRGSLARISLLGIEHSKPARTNNLIRLCLNNLMRLFL